MDRSNPKPTPSPAKKERYSPNKDPANRRQFKCSEELCKYISDRTNGYTLLYFSCGKDSVVAWLQLRRYFPHILPFYMYAVPGLSFVENAIDYYQQYFGCKIYQFPNPSVFDMMRDNVFATPDQADVYDALDYPPDIQGTTDLENSIREWCTGLDNPIPEHAGYGMAMTATGVRSADSINRMSTIRKYGSVNYVTGQFYPIYDFKKERMVKELREANIALPVDYTIFGRTFDGLDARFIEPLKEYNTDDYEKIKAYFGLVDVDIRRLQHRREYWANRNVY